MSSLKKESFVIASSIAAELSAVKRISSDLNLSTLNAKIVTAKSKEIGKTFLPLTNYAGQLANTTGVIVEDISKVALNLTKNSVSLIKDMQTYDAFEKALNKHGKNGLSYSDINNKIGMVKKELYESEKLYASTINKMLLNIDSLSMEVKSIFYLGMNCRIEASRCNEFKNDFESIATDIENAAERVSNIVKFCKNRIEYELKK